MEALFNIIFFGAIILFVIGYRKKGPHKFFNQENVDKVQASIHNLNNLNLKNMFGKISQKIGIVSLIFIGLIVLFNAFTIIPAGNTGVLHFFGKVNPNELQSGFHFKNPLANVTVMSIRTEEYTMSVVREGKAAKDDSISALTKEGLSVGLDITVLYHLDPQKASDVYKDIGIDYQGKIIRPQVRTAIRDVIATYQAKDIYSEKREEVTNKITDKLVSLHDRGIV